MSKVKRYFPKPEADGGMALDIGNGEIRGPYVKYEELEAVEKELETSKKLIIQFRQVRHYEDRKKVMSHSDLFLTGRQTQRG